MNAVSPDPLERAAEATIAAAAAALLWGGADGHGVLAHVAGLNTWRMAASRRVHLYLVQTVPGHVGEPYDDQLVGFVCGVLSCDVAGGPLGEPKLAMGDGAA